VTTGARVGGHPLPAGPTWVAGLYARGMATHQVFNQPPPLENYDPYGSDPVLRQAVEREGGGWGHRIIADFGRRVVSSEVIGWGFDANVNAPRLLTHDRYGHRRDTVEYHPAWHDLLDLSIGHGLHVVALRDGARVEGARVVRDAKFTLVAQIEQGHGCPISMTTSVLPALRVDNCIWRRVWEPAILTRSYDPTLRTPSRKTRRAAGDGNDREAGRLRRAGQHHQSPNRSGGADVPAHRAQVVHFGADVRRLPGARPGPGRAHLLPPPPLPRRTAARNDIRLQRLKDKLGNRSNASSEIELEFQDTAAWRVGEEGAGCGRSSRWSTTPGSTASSDRWGIMRQAVSQAAWHAAIVGVRRRLIDKPLMRNVIADLELEVEAATLMMMRLSGRVRPGRRRPDEEAFRRIATPVAKYWVTKRCTRWCARRSSASAGTDTSRSP
jgi:putative acyl-CoA dehydrogenase